MNLNKVFILGRLTADPQLRATTGGQSVANFSVATNRVWTDKAGQKQETAEFHNVVVWGKQAEIVSRFLNKGSLILVEGRLQTRAWDDKSGQKRKTTEIIAERIQLGPKSAGKSQVAEQEPVQESPNPSALAGQAGGEIPTINIDEEIKEEDLPF